jgi:hypothetical protein
MPLNSSGPISLIGSITGQSIAKELSLSETAQLSLFDSSVRTLLGVASGPISMFNGYGKSNEYAFTIASNQLNANLRTLAIAAGWDQTTKLIATINSAVYVYSNSTGTPALTVSGSFPNGVTLINNGYVVGMGGDGNQGSCGTCPGGGNGGSGGTALSVSSAVTIDNASGVIAGGGGGGGGGGSLAEGANPKSGPNYPAYGWAGGGGGGGQSSVTNSAAGAAGTNNFYQRSRDPQPGTVGTLSAAGPGGIGGAAPNASYYAGYGGNGGSWGSAGATGEAARTYVFNGPPGTGGAAGAAVSGNSNVTWTNTGIRYGGIS